MNLICAVAGDVVYPIIFFLLFVFAIVVGLYYIVRAVSGKEIEFKKLNIKQVFLLMLAGGFVLRIVFALLIGGLVGHLELFGSERVGVNGMFSLVELMLVDANDLYYLYADVSSNPLTMYIHALFAGILKLFGGFTGINALSILFLKLPLILADMGTAFLLYKIARKYFSDTAAIGISIIVLFCPIFLFGSAVWGTSLSLLMFIFVLCSYMMIERKYLLFTIAYAAALLIDVKSLFLFPVFAIYLIYAYIRCLKSYKESKGGLGFSDLWRSDYSLLIKLPVCLICSAIGMYLVCLPLTVGYIGGNPFTFFYTFFIKPLGEASYFSYNGLSVFALFGKNGMQANTAFPIWLFSTLFLSAITAIVAILYWTRKNRAYLLFLSAFVLLVVGYFFLNSSEMIMLPVLALLIMSFCLIKDRRIITIFSVLSFLILTNGFAVLISAGYLVPAAKASLELLSSAGNIINIVCSALTLITLVYYIFVLLDVVSSNKIKKFIPTDGELKSIAHSWFGKED